MLTNLPAYLANGKKALIQITGLLASLLALGIVHGETGVVLASVLGVLTTVTHYLTPNAEAPGTAPALEDFEPPSQEDDDGPVPDQFKPADLVTTSQVLAAPPPAPN